MKIKHKCPFCRCNTSWFVKVGDCHQVECSNCAARGPVYKKKTDAIKGWDYGDCSMIGFFKQPRLLWPEDTNKELDN